MKTLHPGKIATLTNLHLDTLAANKNVANPKDPQRDPCCRLLLQTAPHQKASAKNSASRERLHASPVVGATFACGQHIQPENAEGSSSKMSFHEKRENEGTFSDSSRKKRLRSESQVPSGVSVKSTHSIFNPLNFSGVPVASTSHKAEIDDTIAFHTQTHIRQERTEAVLQRVKVQHKTSMKNKRERRCE
ncbi:hypothetical protein Q8A67_025636 [Cirrhinus molitorella]|uniref:Uncharacterized protein n=1 Tax=Cirrhinus molitorella TaxID=172907 RepID=A0AA88P0I1_9TELE|nr:hypothetical protein Q8A67_025636 [Cirrhinus molitorella]